MSLVRYTAMFALVLFLFACSDDTSSEHSVTDTDTDAVADDPGSTDTADTEIPWDCEDLDLAFGELTSSLLDTYALCSGCESTDCVRVEPVLTCPNGARVTLCQVAVAAALSSDFAAQVEADAAALCDRVEEPCISSASCAATSIVVADDRCELEIDY